MCPPAASLFRRPGVALLCALAGAWIAGPAQAQVFRCTDAQGRITYTGTPCAPSQSGKEVLPAPTPEERAQQEAQYQQALERRRAEQALQAEREAAQAQSDAARAAEQAAQRPQPPVIVQVPPSSPPVVVPSYGPFYPPRPPHGRPPPPPRPQPQPPDTKADGYNCNVFRCYDGKGNTYPRP